MTDEVKIAILERAGQELSFNEEAKETDIIKIGGVKTSGVFSFEDSTTASPVTINDLLSSSIFPRLYKVWSLGMLSDPDCANIIDAGDLPFPSNGITIDLGELT